MLQWDLLLLLYLVPLYSFLHVLLSVSTPCAPQVELPPMG